MTYPLGLSEQIKKPNLFIVGAAKAGTTALVNYLNQHPTIYFSPIKEPHHFSTDIRWEDLREDHKKNTLVDFNDYFKQKRLEEKHIAFVSNRDHYLELFREAENEEVLAEASTGYLYSSVAANEIYYFNPNAKIIIIVRDPVSRTLSHYYMDVAGNKQHRDPLVALREDFNQMNKGYCITNLYVELSLYYEQINRYLNIFPANQILILRQEDLNTSSTPVLEEIVQFLQIEKNDFIINDKINQTLLPKNNFIKRLVGLKEYIPSFLLSKFKKHKKLFFDRANKQEVNNEVYEFIQSKVSEDWIKTEQLIVKWRKLKEL